VASTSSIDRLPSTTTQRPGSAEAISVEPVSHPTMELGTELLDATELGPSRPAATDPGTSSSTTRSGH
jgi:hypothetical protein